MYSKNENGLGEKKQGWTFEHGSLHLTFLFHPRCSTFNAHRLAALYILQVLLVLSLSSSISNRMSLPLLLSSRTWTTWLRWAKITPLLNLRHIHKHVRFGEHQCINFEDLITRPAPFLPAGSGIWLSKKKPPIYTVSPSFCLCRAQCSHPVQSDPSKFLDWRVECKFPFSNSILADYYSSNSLFHRYPKSSIKHLFVKISTSDPFPGYSLSVNYQGNNLKELTIGQVTPVVAFAKNKTLHITLLSSLHSRRQYGQELLRDLEFSSFHCTGSSIASHILSFPVGQAKLDGHHYYYPWSRHSQSKIYIACTREFLFQNYDRGDILNSRCRGNHRSTLSLSLLGLFWKPIHEASSIISDKLSSTR